MVLKPSPQIIKNKPIFGFDTETYDDDNKFLMGSLVGQNLLNSEKFELGAIKTFWNKEEMKNFILNNKLIENSLIFATNLGFDFLALFGDDYSSMSKFNWIVRGSEIIGLSYKKPNGDKIQFLDTMSFLKVSVHNLGKIIECPKLERPEFIGKYVDRFSKEGQYLEKYNIRDSEISARFAYFLQKSFNDIGTNIKYTIASTSMSLFKSKYLKTWMKQPSKEIIKTQYKAYYGGRVEVFYRGSLPENTYFMFDINSLYPYVMKKYVYPNVNTLKIYNSNNTFYKKYEGISLCDINTNNVKDIVKMYPFLPFRTEDKLIFPLGKFSGWYSHAELRYAEELGYNIKIKQTHYYLKDFNPFYDFVTDMYNMRMKYKKTNSPLQMVYKILLNSLYGKFAQKMNYTNIYFINNPDHKIEIDKAFSINNYLYDNGLKDRYKIDYPVFKQRKIKPGEYKKYNYNPELEFFGIKQGVPVIDYANMYYITDLENDNFPHFINPIISIYITGYAKIELYNWYKKIWKINGHIVYSDTDCLITNINLPSSDELGNLKNELGTNTIIKNGIIIKPKMYYVESNEKQLVKVKGCSGVKSWLGFKNLIDTKQITYMKFSKFKESIRRDLPFNSKIIVHKDIDINDTKRQWSNKFNKNVFERSKPLYI